LARGANVGELFGLDRIDYEVVVAAVDADDHSLVDALTRGNEHSAAVLKLPECVPDCFPILGRDQHSVSSLRNLALHRGIAVEHVTRKPSTPRQVHELTLETDQAASRDAVVEPRAASAVGLHVQELTATHTERFHDGALMGIIDVDGKLLEGFAALAP